MILGLVLKYLKGSRFAIPDGLKDYREDSMRVPLTVPDMETKIIADGDQNHSSLSEP